ncbi:hypothetical protein jhhlp_001138 [Lomentospora prolificans]|uniref:Cx9C motif-containing protein 4, mitochondrial n=1 Tax=Lomentospora prolificans TaxID=41688 RepID=A0A2N3NHC9_9PEZI|nr:hypothetical protein jhhlp_001138 [Lomentospora prolificans]
MSCSGPCLKRNQYNETRCQGAILNLFKCCQEFYERNGDSAKSPSCPKPALLEMKLNSLKPS